MPINPLWLKRFAEEKQTGAGNITVLERLDVLPDGETATDEAAPPVSNVRPLMPLGAASPDLEEKIMGSLERALAGIRNEIKRSSGNGAEFDGKKLLDFINIEVSRATQGFAQLLEDERMRAALVNDAWRVRLTLPPTWKAGDNIDFVPPPIIDAYAVLHYEGDVGLAAMRLTTDDESWQAITAEKMKAESLMGQSLSKAG
jgi:hypothetical protein